MGTNDGDLIHKAVLDISDYLKKLNTIDANIDKMARAADKSFSGVSKSSQLSGVQIGAVSGVVQALTQNFINLGQRAAQILADIAADSVALAAKFEANKGLITNIFKGDEEAANAVIDRLVKKSAELGLLPETGVGLGVSFLPDVGSIEQIDKFIEGAVKLKRIAPEKTFEDIRFSLEQLISGDPRAFQDRLNLPLETIQRAKDLQKEYGKVAGSLMLLDELSARFGVNLEDVGDTAIGQLGKFQSRLQALQLAGGAPVVEALKEQLSGLNDILAENSDDFSLIADAFGRILALIVEIVGSGLSDFFASLDTEQATEIAEIFFSIVEDARLFAEVLGATEVPQSLLDGIEQMALQFSEALDTAIKLSLLAKAEAARERAEASSVSGIDLDAFFEKYKKGEATLQEFIDATIAANQAVLGLGVTDEAAAAGQAAYDEVIKEGVALLEESTRRKEENRAATDKLRESQKQATDAGLDEADAFLKQEQAAKDLAAAMDGLAGIEAEVAEKTAKALGKNRQGIEDATTDHERKLTDIATDATRKRLDAAQDFANKRVDLARDNLDKIADLEQEFERDLEKSSLTLSRDIEDAQRDAGRARIEQAKSEAQSQLDIETEHQRRLFDLRKRFDEDLSEFERTRDAVGYLRAIRQRNEEISQAQTDRQRSIDDDRLEGQQKRQELQTQLQQQLEDARIADSRRREDALIALEQSLEDQRENYARQQEELALAESRKNEELRLWEERAIEDANLAHERRLSDLQLALDRELSAIQATEEAKRLEYQKTADAAKAALAEIQAAQAAAGQSQVVQERITSQANADDDRPSSRPGMQNRQRQRAGQPQSRPGLYNQLGRRQHGGPVTAGESFLVGEGGPELFQPNQAGRILPTQALVMPNFGSQSAINNIDSSRHNAPTYNFPVGDASLFNDPIFAAKLRNVLMSTLNEVL